MNPWPIAPLSTRRQQFAVIDYFFRDLTASELGPLPPLEDFLDTTLVDAAASLADQTVLIASMDGDLNDLGNILNELATDDFDQILADLAAIASAGDTLLNDFSGLIG